MNKTLLFFSIIFLSCTHLFTQKTYTALYISQSFDITPLKETAQGLCPQTFNFYNAHRKNNIIDLWTMYSLFHKYGLVKTISIKESESNKYVGLLVWRHPFTNISWDEIIQKAAKLTKDNLISFIQELSIEKDMTLAEIEICRALTKDSYKELLTCFDFIIDKKVHTINIRDFGNNQEACQAYVEMEYEKQEEPCSTCKRWCWRKNRFIPKNNLSDDEATE